MQVTVYKIHLRMHEKGRRYLAMDAQTPAGRIIRTGNWVDAPEDIGAIIKVHGELMNKTFEEARREALAFWDSVGTSHPVA